MFDMFFRRVIPLASAPSLWMWFPLVVDLLSSLDNIEMIILSAIHKMRYYTTLKMIHLKKTLMASKNALYVDEKGQFKTGHAI